MTRILPALILCATAFPAIAASPADVLNKCETLEPRLKFFDTQSLIYKRSPFRYSGAGVVDNHVLLTNQLSALNAGVDDIVPLLSHTNAHIRTLALAAMFVTEDPRMLPHLVPVVDDNAETWPSIAIESRAVAFHIGGLHEDPPRTNNQTVGRIATQMLSFYMQPAGYHYGVKGSGTDNPGFERYWNDRKSRKYCASWFYARLLRASAGTSPTQKDAIPAIRQLRNDIDRIPEPDCTWTLLWLNGESGSDALIDEKELVARCKTIPPDKLLALLQNRIPSDDPDLQPRRMNNYFHKRMQIFVLKHAAELLPPDAAPAILACDAWQRDYQKHGITDPNITPWWTIAAASLQPQKAASLLKNELARPLHALDERGDIAVALWKLCGTGEIDYLADWFFRVKPDHSSFPNCRTQFIQEAAVTKEPDGRRLMARLVSDPRMADTDWATTEGMIRVVNGWLPKPLVGDDDIRKAWHPYGIGTFDRDRSKAAREYPKETAALLQILADWRATLASSRSSWGSVQEKD